MKTPVVKLAGYNRQRNHCPHYAFVVLFFVICLSKAYCSVERTLHPLEISLKAQAEKPLGEISLTVHSVGKGDARRISNMILNVNGRSIHVPDKAYTDLRKPILNSLQLRTEEDENGKTAFLYICFQVENTTSDGIMRPKQVRLHYHEGRIESRSFTTPDPEGGSSFKQEKL